MNEELEALHHAIEDRYVIERELGRGGMGTVYLAKDRKHNRQVALKVLSPSIGSGIVADRFLREIETIARLMHPHILPLHDSGKAGDYVYFVMPYVEGETLRSRMDKVGPLPVAEAVRIAREVASALDYAHRRDIVHRDVKPENVLLQEESAILADFGVARALAGKETLTASGVTVGTPTYMSPEQARGKEVDGRSDVYALGCVLYEMVTGQPPFTATDIGGVLRQHIAVDPVPPRTLRQALPASIDALIMRSLAKKRDDRFADAAEFAAALRSAEVSGATGTVDASSTRARFTLAAGGVVAVALAGWLIATSLPTATPVIESLAVLPLQNLMGDSTQEYFVDGMTEALIANLAQVEALKVISRTTVMQYKGSTRPLPELARELGVEAVIEGSVLRDGERVRISVQLVDATDRHLWADSYERRLADVLSLQMEVARAVAREVRVTLTASERERLTHARPVDPEAYEAYLLGRFHWNRRTRPDFLAAISAFERAIAVDPTYALPYSGLADSYIMLVEWRHMLPTEGAPLALTAAQHALRLDSTSAEAYTSLGEVLITTFDWVGAERAFRRALELNPGYATGHQWFGFFLSKMGRDDEAIAELERAVALDPRSLIIKTEAARVYYHAGRNGDALRMVEATEALDPTFGDVSWVRGNLAIEEGRYADAIEWFARARPSIGFVPELAGAYARAGRLDEARRVLTAMQDDVRASGREISAGLLAQARAALGDTDSALALLELAYERGADDFLSYLRVARLFDPMRDDPRFVDLMRRLRLD